jgi:hypothetical protein
VIPVALILVAAFVLMLRRQARLSRDRARFDLQVLGVEMLNLEHRTRSATPLLRRKSRVSSLSRRRSAVGPIIHDTKSQTDLLRTPHAAWLKVPDLEYSTEVSTDAALGDAGCATLALSARDSNALRTQHRIRRSRSLNALHAEVDEGILVNTRIPASFEYASNTSKAAAVTLDSSLDGDALRTHRTRRTRRTRSVTLNALHAGVDEGIPASVFTSNTLRIHRRLLVLQSMSAC